MLEVMKDLNHCKDRYLRHEDLWSTSQLRAELWFTGDGKLQTIFWWNMLVCKSFKCQKGKHSSDKENIGKVFSSEEQFLGKVNCATK